MMKRVFLLRTCACLLLSVAAAYCGDPVKVEFRTSAGASATLSDAAAARFLQIVASKPREAKLAPGDPSPKPLGSFKVGAVYYAWEANAVHTTTGSRRKIWTDPGFTRMYTALRDRSFQFAPDILEKLLEP
jgi:hypothetical protein